MGRTSKTYGADIRALDTAKMTIQQVADAVGCSRATAYRHLKNEGLPYAGRKNKTDYDDKLLTLDTESMTYQEVAEVLGVNPVTIHRRMNVLNLPYKNKGKLKKSRIRVGDIIGRLTVRKVEPGKITCICECGNTVTGVPGSLQHRSSCGCLARDYKQSLKGSYLDEHYDQIVRLYNEGHTPGEIAYHMGVDRKHMAQWVRTRIEGAF